MPNWLITDLQPVLPSTAGSQEECAADVTYRLSESFDMSIGLNSIPYQLPSSFEQLVDASNHDQDATQPATCNVAKYQQHEHVGHQHQQEPQHQPPATMMPPPWPQMPQVPRQLISMSSDLA